MSNGDCFLSLSDCFFCTYISESGVCNQPGWASVCFDCLLLVGGGTDSLSASAGMRIETKTASQIPRFKSQNPETDTQQRHYFIIFLILEGISGLVFQLPVVVLIDVWQSSQFSTLHRRCNPEKSFTSGLSSGWNPPVGTGEISLRVCLCFMRACNLDSKIMWNFLVLFVSGQKYMWKIWRFKDQSLELKLSNFIVY